ncbi:MAG: Bax inhibitor-1/YccA family protein [Candidatus Brocadiaceae bacterium]|nr:Bax inhibitor-1/YccA family protein [Candidatus Brocadiaceae bacterium]
MIARSANPSLNKNTFSNVRGFAFTEKENMMTLQGTVNKTAILLSLALLSAFWVWRQFFIYESPQISMYLLGGAIGGLIAAMVAIFKPTTAPIAAPVYALLEGLFLGGISSFMEARFPGIVIQAVGLTFGTLFALLFAYKSGLIKATENFKLGVAAATGGIFMVYMVSFILGFFGMNVPFIHGNGIIGIGISGFIVIIAALNLVLDFDFIEHGVEHGAPRFMEWRAALGLMITLVWLYIEILHLLSKLRSR